MKKIITAIVLSLVCLQAWAQHSSPEKGDIGAIVTSRFQEEEDAMRFVVREILFKMNIIPDVYDKDLGYIVTERFYYQGWMNCQFVLFFKSTGENVSVKIIGRNYEANSGEGMHRGPMSYAKGMDGSPVKSYWTYLTSIAERIPNSSIEYFSK